MAEDRVSLPSTKLGSFTATAMTSRRRFRRAWLLLAALAVAGAPATAPAETSLAGLLEPYLERHGLPAVGAAVVKDGRIVAVGAAGTRRAGARIPVTTRDRFHLGSDTKAVTALLAAILVEERKIRWDSTVADVFPELAPKMTTGLGRVTLEQLLSHTGGLPPDNDAFVNLLVKSGLEDGNLDELRYWLVAQWSPQPLETEPGTTFAYSNLGYTLAGAMLERVGRATWEELVVQRVFRPLALRSAGFGPTSAPGRIDAPLGHLVVDGRVKPLLAGPSADNPAILGPAGTAHMSLLDFARWAGWNAGQGKRGPRLVRPETLRKLHTPVIAMPERKDAAPGTPSRGRYALGWGEVTHDWAPEPFVFHGGSNRKNLAHILLQPRHDFAMVLVTNVSGRQADQALYALARALYRQYGPR